MKLQTLICVLSVTTFCGCSSSTPNEKDAAKAAPAATGSKSPVAAKVVDARPIIAAFGDSLTAGAGVAENENYPFYMQQLLDERGVQYRVVNHGLSGDTTSGGVDRVPQVLADKPKIVVLELGGNDGLRGIPVATTLANFETIIEKLQASGAKVVLAGITLPRNYGEDYIKDFDAMFKTLAQKYKLPFIPFFLENVALVPGMMQQDGIHATAKGNKVVAFAVFRKVEMLTEK